MKIVIKIGGSLIQDKKTGVLNTSLIKEYAEILVDLLKNGHILGVVVGGGKTAREYIETARKLGASEADCDEIGIAVSRLNARLLINALGEVAYPTPASTFDEAVKATLTGKIVIMGGTQPGQSTNAVAAIFSEYLKADLLINATDVDGVYLGSPDKPGSKLLKEVSTDELYKLIYKNKFSAGTYPLFDILALKIIARSHIPTRIINGKTPENIVKAVRGEDVGTLIKSS
ncbi:MAG: UMP kinase [Candidatus Odinarchaeia archaeon]